MTAQPSANTKINSVPLQLRALRRQRAGTDQECGTRQCQEG